MRYRDEVITRKDILTSLNERLKNKEKQVEQSPPVAEQKPSSPKKSSTINNVVAHLTSSLSFYFFAFLFLLVGLTSREPRTFSAGILSAISWVVVTIIVYLITSFIPLLSEKTALWNYLVNIIVQATIFILCLWIDRRT
jgi:lipopolysaccharide export LptBFGC system permease protein LptF